jgi:hypothetical protein
MIIAKRLGLSLVAGALIAGLIPPVLADELPIPASPGAASADEFAVPSTSKPASSDETPMRSAPKPTAAKEPLISPALRAVRVAHAKKPARHDLRFANSELLPRFCLFSCSIPLFLGVGF